jgi:NAD+ synthase (glutamine-hydrolysing)
VVAINSNWRIALAQINATLGDLSGNSDKILQAVNQAQQQGASLVITPELALTGYPPEDLLLRSDFLQATQATLHQLASQVQGITLLVGYPASKHGKVFNAAAVICDGQVTHTYFKQILPNHSVFDEERYFEAGTEACVFEHQGLRCGVLICADIWEREPALKAKQAGAEILLSLNASPFHVDKQNERFDVAAQRVRETGLALVYTNLVGGQDELVFDGDSFALDRSGVLVLQAACFATALPVLQVSMDGQDKGNLIPAEIRPAMTRVASVYQALCLGVRDYIQKNGFPSVLLGLSGGIDSALTLAIAVDALGKDKVSAVMMPSQFTADISVSDAHQMAHQLGVDYHELPIEALFQAFNTTLSPIFQQRPFDTTEENIQARIRGVLLMALSNKFGSLVLITGNKSEMAVGYSTLYGDMAGGFAVLKDVPKTLVYELSKYRNQIDSSPVIPERIITRAPSAELRADQTDQDSLPPYEILDGILQAYVEEDASFNDILSLGYARKDIERVISLIDRNEYKRRQAPIGVRITHRGFGKDRRYPVTSKFSYKNTL